MEDPKRDRQRFSDQPYRLNSQTNQAIRDFQREMARPNSSMRHAIDAMQNDLSRPTNRAREAMALLQREREVPYRNALDSIREMQKQMMLPHDRLAEISRSAAAASALEFDQEYLRGFSNLFAPTMKAIQDLKEQIGQSQLNQIAEIAKEAAKRQAELLSSSWSGAVFASAFRAPEIDLMLKGIATDAAKPNADFLKSFSVNFFDSIQRSGALANLNLLRQTHAAQVAQQFREAVEKSEDSEQLATEITAIVEENLKETEGNDFVTKERLMMLIAILSLLGTIYQCFIGTLQHLNPSPQQSPVIQTHVLRELPGELLRKFFPTSRYEDIVEYLLVRDARLMVQPAFRSQQAGNAMAGSRARLIVRNHKWIFVEVFNSLEGISQYGWINKKYSKRIY